ncbi:MAG: hypothetical protein ACRD1I_07335 [Terriglobia bacterium]
MGKEALTACVLALVLTPGLFSRNAATASATPLDVGYQEMYDLRFDQARRSFEQWQRLHPADPMGPASEAASYLFSEFNRLDILHSQFFVDNKQFKERPRPAPNPAAKQAFESAIGRSLRLANARLAGAPDDTNALLAKVLDDGLRADYLALIEGRNLASLRYMKRAGTLADRLLKTDPSCYDAYLATGAENYLLSLNPAPVRWMLRLYGVESDKARGIQELQLTAEKGHYLRPYARLLLAVVALRDKNRSQAMALLEGLARDFPDNPLYAQELALLQ